ncbi:MAG: hypothetical protein ACRENA_12380 [Vulcanimicrobiaceae bacterium]
MKHLVMACAAVAFVFVVGIQPSDAQKIPHGSYEQSCWKIHVQNGQLTAVCKNHKGTWGQRSWLRLPCHGDIVNVNSRLVCRR